MENPHSFHNFGGSNILSFWLHEIANSHSVCMTDVYTYTDDHTE